MRGKFRDQGALFGVHVPNVPKVTLRELRDFNRL